jgi:uncharacterized Zn finger protein
VTITCDACGGSMEVVDTNGAEYPESLRETRECQSCGYTTTEVLTA